MPILISLSLAPLFCNKITNVRATNAPLSVATVFHEPGAVSPKSSGARGGATAVARKVSLSLYIYIDMYVCMYVCM